MNHQAAPLKATKSPCFIITLVLFYFDHMAEELLKENKGYALPVSVWKAPFNLVGRNYICLISLAFLPIKNKI